MQDKPSWQTMPTAVSTESLTDTDRAPTQSAMALSVSWATCSAQHSTAVVTRYVTHTARLNGSVYMLETSDSVGFRNRNTPLQQKTACRNTKRECVTVTRLSADYSRSSDWLRTGRFGVRIPVGEKMFSSPRCPDRLWGPHSLLRENKWRKRNL